METLRLSRYAIPFIREGHHLIFLTQSCNFYEVKKDVYDEILKLNVCPATSAENLFNRIKPLVDAKILTSEEEDDEYIRKEKTLFYSSGFSPVTIGMTIVPTISCNLRCPYCFEQTKPTGIMTKEIADKIIEFIKSHQNSSKLHLCWYGGEPLIGADIISYLLPKLYSIDGIDVTNHSMISNGTLISPQILSIFRNFPLNSVQITLDGDRENHNSKRFFADGSGTFDIILDNIESFSSAFPDTNISLRVNVDNSNWNDYFSLQEAIGKRFADRNIQIYPGVLRANNGCENETFFSSEDHLKFYKRIWSNGSDDRGYPHYCHKGCSATHLSSYIIGPKGEIYKCWEHVGNYDKTVGNILGKSFDNESLIHRFMLDSHCLDDPKCTGCALLPICSGGCPKKRLENKYEQTKHDLCSIYKGETKQPIEDILYEYYKTQTKQP
ncbi:MAG: SPASM domain-containing protein [Muribaculum sp.]|nr:SPASM domain-containing protein [Muribaculum sp.]